MALSTTRLYGRLVDEDGTPVAGTLVATPILPGNAPLTDYLIPSAKTLTIPSTGVLPASPLLEVSGNSGTWPGGGTRYRLVFTSGSTTLTTEIQLDRGDTAMHLGDIQLPVRKNRQARVVTLTDAATIAIDADKGDNFKVTVAGNRTLGNPTNALDGQLLRVSVKQDGTGSRTVTLGSKYRLATSQTITWSTAAGKTDRITVQYDEAADKFDVVDFRAGY